MKNMHNLKIIFGTVMVIGTLLQGVELYFDPDVLLLESSPQYPEYLFWMRWIITFIAVVGYLYIDSKEHKKDL